MRHFQFGGGNGAVDRYGQRTWMLACWRPSNLDPWHWLDLFSEGVSVILDISMEDFTMKVVTKRHGKQDPIREAAGLQEFMLQMRGPELIPNGVYRFTSMEEADTWMIKTIAKIAAKNSRVRRRSTTSFTSAKR